MPLSSRKHLGRLELLGEIHLGGGGEFFHARDTRNGQAVGVQILPFTRGAPIRFEAIHHRAAQLKHRNILAVRGLRAKVDISYIVTEPFEGESLATMLKHGPLAIPASVDFAVQIAQALEAAHAASVVHGGVSPSHVLVDAGGNLKVFGFAVAKQPDFNDYLSPEAIRGEALSPRSDIFNFGSILYEMLAGHAPFRCPTAAETAHAVLEDASAALPAKIPEDLALVVARCLEKDPAHRFQSAAELNAALRNPGLQSVAEPVAELPPPEGRLQVWLDAAKVRWAQAKQGWTERVPAPNQKPVSWTAIALVALIILVAADLVTRAIAHRTSETPIFQRLTFRQGPILRARFANNGQSVAYTARFEGTPQTSYLTTVASGAVRDLKLPPNSAIVAISSKGDVALRLSDGSLARMPLNGGDFVNQATSVLDADFSPSGDTLAVARYNPGTANYFLEYPVGKVLVQSSTPIDLVRVSPQGEQVAYAMVEGAQKRLWMVNKVGAAHMLADLGSGDVNRSLSWSNDGREIWFGSTTQKDRGIIRAVSLQGKLRTVDWMPELQLDDIGAHGEALVEMFRSWNGTRVRDSSESGERDLSWFGETVNVNLPADGSQVFFTEHEAAGGGVSGVYVRSRKGTPALRLCDGSLVAVSPDGKWASVYRSIPQPRYFLVSADGAHEQPVAIPALEGQTAAVIAWLHGGAYLVWGNRPRHGKQHFVWNPSAGKLLPVSPPGSSIGLASDDGTRLLASTESGAGYVFTVDGGGKPSAALGLLPSDRLLRWTLDDKSVFTAGLSENRRDFSIFKVNVANGARSLWKVVEPDIPADSTSPSAITPNGTTYAYIYYRAQSDLFLAHGLK